jgi:predicted DCC family thiol-disulfide oxidoreductase YuxK
MSSPSNLADRSEWADTTVVIYDGECPFCSRFVTYQRLRESIGPLKLIDARQRPDLVREFAAADMPLDQGMALIMGGQVYYGADCVNRLALLSSRSGLFNKLNALIFHSPTVSRLLYPVLRAGRNLTLRVLGYSKLIAEPDR